MVNTPVVIHIIQQLLYPLSTMLSRPLHLSQLKRWIKASPITKPALRCATAGEEENKKPTYR